MTVIPPLSVSAQSALTGGFARLDRAATEIVGAFNSIPPAATDSVDIRSNVDADPLLTGVRDLMLAKLQVGAGALLLHTYRDNRQDLFDMLRP